VPVGTVVREARRWAKVFSMWSALAMGAILTAVSDGLAELDMEKAMDIEAHQFISLQGSEDMTEGLAAFIEKRRPKFQDK
jgi:enoyl-CoA hydratase